MGTDVRISIRSGVVHITVEHSCIVTIIPIAADNRKVTSIKITIVTEKGGGAANPKKKPAPIKYMT